MARARTKVRFVLPKQNDYQINFWPKWVHVRMWTMACWHWLGDVWFMCILYHDGWRGWWSYLDVFQSSDESRGLIAACCCSKLGWLAGSMHYSRGLSQASLHSTWFMFALSSDRVHRYESTRLICTASVQVLIQMSRDLCAQMIIGGDASKQASSAMANKPIFKCITPLTLSLNSAYTAAFTIN